jgi:hypothetical protein
MTINAKTLSDIIKDCDYRTGNAGTTGVKHDTGKIKAGILAEFPNAMLAIAEVGTFGANKYSRGNWKKVDDAEQRYMDAMWRHLLTAGKDSESGLDHLAHFVWNAMAVLELKRQKSGS